MRNFDGLIERVVDRCQRGAAGGEAGELGGRTRPTAGDTGMNVAAGFAGLGILAPSCRAAAW
jgi:hypothetical protein